MKFDLEEIDKPSVTEKILVVINKRNGGLVLDYAGIGVREEFDCIGSNFDEWCINDFPRGVDGPGLYVIEIRWRDHRDWETGMIDDSEMVYVSHKKVEGFEKLFKDDLLKNEK